jgi:hypothetical protein
MSWHTDAEGYLRDPQYGTWHRLLPDGSLEAAGWSREAP